MNAGNKLPISDRAQEIIERLQQKPLRFVCAWRGNIGGYFPMHSHPVMELVYHPRGSGVTSLESGQKIEFQAHGTVIYPARVRHDQRLLAPGVDICIHAAQDPSCTEEWFPEALYIAPESGESRHADRFVRTEFFHLAQVRSDPNRRVELNLRVTALMARLLQLSPLAVRDNSLTSPESHVELAREFVNDNYAKITSAGEIARHVGVSEDYLRHLFLEHGGTSLNRLLNQTRIERAKELLIHSRLPIKEIAALSGFKTERYLCTRFKQLTGSGPGAFRRQTLEQMQMQ